jgi:hypothetical protein
LLQARVHVLDGRESLEDERAPILLLAAGHSHAKEHLAALGEQAAAGRLGDGGDFDSEGLDVQGVGH